MRVILRTDVPKLGKTGEICEVSAGYARNFLIPQRLAYPATPGAESKVAEEQRIKQRRVEKEHRSLLELAGQLRDVSLTIAVTVGSQDQLYGSVNEREIVEALKQEYSIELEEKNLKLEEPIRQLGVYRVPVRLAENVESMVTVWVVKSDGQHQS